MADHPAQYEFLPPPSERYYEDYRQEANVYCGNFTLGEEEIVEFARQFDPQPMHIDRTSVGGVIASGWHTICKSMRLIADNYLPTVAGLPSPGVDSIQWSHPVRPYEVISVYAHVESARVSASKPDRGIVTSSFIANNADKLAVMSFRAVSFIRRREHRESRLDHDIQI